MTESGEETRRLLGDGEPSRVGADGNTPLHQAVKNGRFQVAAALLLGGADWTLRNAEGKTALDLEFASLPALHRIRQEYQRLPVAPYDRSSAPCADVESYVSQLERDGILKVSGLVGSEQLAQMQSDFGRLVGRLDLARMLFRKRFSHYDQEEYWHAEHRSYVTNDALACSAGLLSLCCDPVVIETANHYLHKTSHIKRTYAMRYLPSEAIHSNQFGWHHDMEDRQLKLMIILTDVEENDQYMTYIRGSHNVFHSYPQFLKNTLDFDYCRTYLSDIESVKTIGRAGDAFFFDSNGMHRGNRSRGRVRDALFIEFTADKNANNLWGTALSRDRIPASVYATNHPLKALLGATPKWKRTRNQAPRTRPSWADSLEDPSTWL